MNLGFLFNFLYLVAVQMTHSILSAECRHGLRQPSGMQWLRLRLQASVTDMRRYSIFLPYLSVMRYIILPVLQNAKRKNRQAKTACRWWGLYYIYLLRSMYSPSLKSISIGLKPRNMPGVNVSSPT